MLVAIKTNAASFGIHKDHGVIPVKDFLFDAFQLEISHELSKTTGCPFLKLADISFTNGNPIFKETINYLFNPVYTDIAKIQKRKTHSLQHVSVLNRLLN